jgi:hypothetical protein
MEQERTLSRLAEFAKLSALSGGKLAGITTTA